MDQKQLNQTENNMPPKKKKSPKDAMKVIATMGANLGSMMSGFRPRLIRSQSMRRKLR